MRARLLRPVLLGSVLGLIASASIAGAAPASCNLVTDDEGDATGFVFTDEDYLPNNPQLDLLSGDVASNAKTVTAVIRTKELALTDSQSPTGRAYYANFTADGTELYLAVRLDGSGAGLYSAGYIDGRRIGLGAATGVIDVAKKEIRISAPISLFAEQANLKPGRKITDLNLLAQRFIGAAGAGATPSADAAEGGKAYTTGSKSCVTVGK